MSMHKIFWVTLYCLVVKQHILSKQKTKSFLPSIWARLDSNLLDLLDCNMVFTNDQTHSL